MKFWTLTFLLILLGCQPSAVRRVDDLAIDSDTPDSSNLNLPSGINWYFGGNYGLELKLNETNNDVAYLRGQDVHDYLTDVNYAKEYCVSILFQSSNPTKELRFKATPISFSNSKGTERLLRVEANNNSLSSINCSFGIETYNSNTQSYLYTPPNPANLSYQNKDACPTCSSLLSSITITLYLKRTGTVSPAINVLEGISSNTFDLTSLDYLIDYNNPTTSGGSGGGTCTNAGCADQGFNCCLNNQCVNNGQEKPGASTNDPTLYAQSQLEILGNPLAYLNYPSLYFVCPQGGTTTGSSSGGGSPSDGPNTVNQIIKDNLCITELKDNSEATPFHLEPINGAHTYVNCEDTDNTDDMYYQKVMSRMYNYCGCNETTFSLQVQNCPYYIYQVKTTNSQGVPTSFSCTTVTINNNPPPLQTKVELSSKTAPHRFFNSDGVEIDPYKTVTVSNTNQEGSPFTYLDSEKTLPLNGSFNMNSILGPMTVALDQARPAVSIDIEENQTYIISTTSGSYSTCSTCAKDSWYNSFSPFPGSIGGSGLNGIVYSTSRSSYDGNFLFANYEDTHFGRACYVPPTMIPYSHTEESDTQAQRLARLKTQAALYINGYQKDWYGFNLGAVIASFDGVSWFAVGKGRIASSTSNKLYLAINAPYADLANNNIHAIDIQIFDGSQSKATHDYDPSLSLTHPNQNTGGTCQANHQCETDTDCITKLGWEYACADVGKMKTKWPNFLAANSFEVANQSRTLSLTNILTSGFIGPNKRCVYRGAGAPCRTDFYNISDEGLRKNLACAPNFYCASLTQGNVFNKEVARFGAKLDQLAVTKNHFYGKDANLLGRPLHYISSAELGSLPSDVITTISENLALADSTGVGNFGLCRPGKAVPSANGGGDPERDPHVQHTKADNLYRTDFISEIGSCDAGNYSSERVASCPVLDIDGNYLYTDQTINITDYLATATTQNSCGLESLLNGTPFFGTGANTLLNYSPFKNIESKPLNVVTQILEPTLARDACLRRAGAVCHTDLDCGPNKLHSEEVGIFSDSYYGNEAEKNYFSEYLVCGQAKAKPNTADSDYYDYDLTLNRCCRPSGTDITMYTHKDTNPDFDTNTQNINPRTYGASNPSSATRYSRYSVVNDLFLSGDANVPSADTAPAATYPITAQKQWKAIHETGKRTCCGGTWIRKFSDGSTDWTQNRQTYNIQDFACLNYSTPLVDPAYLESQTLISAADRTHIENQLGLFCLDAAMTTGDFACAQRPLVGANLPTALPAAATAQVRSVTNTGITNANYDLYGAYVFSKMISADTNQNTYADFSVSAGSRQRNNIHVRLPGFILPSDVISYQYYTVGNPSASGACVATALAVPTGPEDTLACGSACCYDYDATDNTILFAFNGAVQGGGNDIEVGITFAPPGSSAYGTAGMDRGLEPANFEYYLKRLERFELTGVPQITYMPLYCTNDYERMVPGLFQDQTLSNFALNGFIDPDADNPFDATIVDPDNDQYVTTLLGLSDEYQDNPVFSGHEFKCCIGLGEKTGSPSNCCSNYGTVKDGDSKYTCQLPARTDLNLYFNKFISGEGLEEDIGLSDLTGSEDFDERTGYPRDLNTVNQKIIALGEKHCASESVRRGAAFGFFTGQPNNGFGNPDQGVYSIVDSSADYATSSSSGETVEVGAAKFNDGFRWNNHYYCDDE